MTKEQLEAKTKKELATIGKAQGVELKMAWKKDKMIEEFLKATAEAPKPKAAATGRRGEY